MTGMATIVCPVDGCLNRRFAPLHVSVDVFHHDNGVVYDDAKYQDEPKQRHAVNRFAVGSHERKRNQERRGNANRNEDRVPKPHKDIYPSTK